MIPDIESKTILFAPAFWPAIKAQTKLSTIRRADKDVRFGDILNLKCADSDEMMIAQCTAVYGVAIKKDGSLFMEEGSEYMFFRKDDVFYVPGSILGKVHDDLVPLYPLMYEEVLFTQEGFKSMAELVAAIDSLYELPFEGKIIFYRHAPSRTD